MTLDLSNFEWEREEEGRGYVIRRHEKIFSSSAPDREFCHICDIDRDVIYCAVDIFNVRNITKVPVVGVIFFKFQNIKKNSLST